MSGRDSHVASERQTDASRVGVATDRAAERKRGRFAWLRSVRRWLRERRQARAQPPERFRLLGCWYRLEGISVHGRDWHGGPPGPITYRYLPEEGP